MSGKTKIFVLHMKEVIYTGIFIFLGLIFLVLLVIMFLPKTAAVDSSTETTENKDYDSGQSPAITEYTPGIYAATLEVSGSNLEMQVIIEETGITNVSFTHLDETIQTMYPLFTPVLENISNQLKNGTPLADITYDDSQKYTATILLDTIETILEQAAH